MAGLGIGVVFDDDLAVADGGGAHARQPTRRAYLRGNRRARRGGGRLPAMTAPPPRAGAALAVLLAGTFMASLDTAIVNVAGPAIQADVGVSGAALQLVISGYALAYAALLITGARLGDDHGHRRLFLAGLAGFTVMSLLAGWPGRRPVLIAARIGQGVAAAAMGPQVMTVIQLQYDGAARMKAMALLATVVSAGVVAGQVLGGALVDLDLLGASWRPVFLINVPVGLALLAIGPRLLPVTRRPSGRRMDWLGVALMTDVITLVMVPLTFGHEVGWAWWTWACWRWPCRRAALVTAPAAAGRPRPLAGSAAAPRPVPGRHARHVAMMVAYGGFLLTFTLHLQQGLGDSPLRGRPDVRALRAGLRGREPDVPRCRTGPPGGWPRSAWRPPPPATLGLGVITGDGAWHDAETLPLLALAGAGFGAGYSQVVTRSIAVVPAAHAHEASGVFNTTNMFAFALGIATLGSAFLSAVGAPTPEETGAAFEVVALGCAALLVAAVGLVGWLARVEAGQAQAAQARPVRGRMGPWPHDAPGRRLPAQVDLAAGLRAPRRPGRHRGAAVHPRPRPGRCASSSSSGTSGRCAPPTSARRCASGPPSCRRRGTCTTRSSARSTSTACPSCTSRSSRWPTPRPSAPAVRSWSSTPSC